VALQNVQSGDTALIWAARKGRLELCEQLLQHPALDVEVHNNAGKSCDWL
jgi:ankyrin repeat protein